MKRYNTKHDIIKQDIENTLRFYNTTCKQIETISLEIIYINGDITLSGIDYEGISVSPTNEVKSVVENECLSMIEKIENLEDVRRRLIGTLEDVDKWLDSLSEKEKKVIREYYINNNTWETVSEIIGFSSKQCGRIRNGAIGKIVEKVMK